MTTSSIKTLVVRKGEEEFTISLDKERVIVGREAGCDLILDDRSISRQHLAVVFRYGAIYVENLSPTGYLEKNGQQTEYAELQPGDEIKFGPYTLSLGGAAEGSDFLYKTPGATPDSESKMDLEGSNRQQGFGPLDDGKTNVSISSKQVEAELMSNSKKKSDSDLDLPLEGIALTNNRSKFNQEIGSDAESVAAEPLDAASFDNEENTATGAGKESAARSGEESYHPPEAAQSKASAPLSLSIGTPVSANFPADGTGVSHAATKIVGNDPRPRLRITKTEEVGREIKLESGSSWVIGRSKRSGIVINHPSISRQHFKIVKIQDKYRIQDLGSSRGVKVNGVNVTDAPLSPFDTILAGKVEMQFLLVDEALAHMSSSELMNDQKSRISATGLSIGISGSSGQLNLDNETQPQINLPAIQGFNASPENASFTAQQAPPDMSGVESTGDAGVDENGDAVKVSILVRLRNLPPKQRAIAIGGVAVVLIAILAAGLMGGGSEQLPDVPKPTLPVAKNPALPKPTNPNAAANTAPNATSNDASIDPKFFSMSRTDREEIETWYAEAEKSLRSKDWNKVISRGSDILAKLEKYKSTQDFVLQAQAELGTVAATSADAGMNVDDKVAALLANAREALDKQDWETAETNATKVLNIAPDNTEALDLIQAAKSKGSVTKANIGTAQEIAPPTPEDPEKQEQYDYLAALTAQYRQASDYLRAGEYSRAMPVLVDLDDKIYEKIQEQRSGRKPAAYTQELVGEMQALGDQVKSSYDSATSKLTSEYSTQLQDASAFVQNRQYIQAREVYDSILLKEPFFDDAKKARLKLYDQIIIEARRLYQEALISESIGDLKSAADNLQKTVELLTNVKDMKAIEYFQKSKERMARLQR